jgi:hypothetical protein
MLPLANAAATVAVALYAICRVLALVVPDTLRWIAQSWFHGLALAPDGAASLWLDPTEFLVGLITLGAVAWLATAATAWLYNAWSHR